MSTPKRLLHSNSRLVRGGRPTGNHAPAVCVVWAKVPQLYRRSTISFFMVAVLSLFVPIGLYGILFSGHLLAACIILSTPRHRMISRCHQQHLESLLPDE
jgi:hypothetical protein